MKAILVCVNYDDLLSITLPRNARNFDEVLVVSSPDDKRTAKVVEQIPNCRTFVTDAFYRHGAKFNKGLALEEGFDELGRTGWIHILDADILLPSAMKLPELNPNALYCAPRRVLNDPDVWSVSCRESDWNLLPSRDDWVFAGYFQLFNADSPVCQRRPWYDVTYAHAGCSDEIFQNRWDSHQKIWLPFNVLHLGPTDSNWCGRSTKRIDGNQNAPEAALWNRSLRARFGWDRAGGSIVEIEDRVHVNH